MSQMTGDGGRWPHRRHKMNGWMEGRHGERGEKDKWADVAGGIVLTRKER